MRKGTADFYRNIALCDVWQKRNKRARHKKRGDRISARDSQRNYMIRAARYPMTGRTLPFPITVPSND